MDKNIFKQYTDMLSEIKDIEKRMDELERNTVTDSVKASGDFPYSVHNCIIKGVDNKLYYKYKNMLKKRKEKLTELKGDILGFIEIIEDSKVRQIFMYRYIDGLEWYKIADKMGYNGESAPRKKHDRFLKNL